MCVCVFLCLCVCLCVCVSVCTLSATQIPLDLVNKVMVLVLTSLITDKASVNLIIVLILWFIEFLPIWQI